MDDPEFCCGRCGKKEQTAKLLWYLINTLEVVCSACNDHVKYHAKRKTSTGETASEEEDSSDDGS